MKRNISFKLSVYQKLKETDWANPVILENSGEEVTIKEIDELPNYPIILSDGMRCSVNGKNLRDVKLTIEYDVKSPFIDGRIVSDITFAKRFLSFIKDVKVCDPCSEDEKEYLENIARDLLDWQTSSVTDEEERKYFERIGIKV